MKERSFIITELNNGWQWFDIHSEDDVQVYCEEELEVPIESIKRLDCYNNCFEISLINSRRYYRDDWYINLQRSA